MDITDALRRAENLLRDCIAEVMQAKYGDTWISLHVTPDTIGKWARGKTREGNKQRYGVVEERLIYYADFADLKPILQSRWDADFRDIFDVDWTKMEVWFDALHLVRNQEAHGRAILDYQKHLAMGAAGEIRTRFIRYRSKMETAEDYFPRIERVNDDFGNIWTLGSDKVVQTKTVLRDGDLVTFTITASDPQGVALEYSVVSKWRNGLEWRSDNVQPIEVTRIEIGKESRLEVYIRSTDGKEHAHGHWDDTVAFTYTILPRKTT